MTKISVEVCVISARGLRRSSSLLKPYWFAVAWIDPNDKYYTKASSSSSSNPTWKAKFSVVVDDVNSNLLGTSLTIEVYKRGPVFRRDKLQGAATVLLKELFAELSMEALRSGVEEVGSFQLRRRKSSKPRGFVDISVRLSGERERVSSSSGTHGGSDHQNEIQLAIEDGPVLANRLQPQLHGNSQYGGHHTGYPYSSPTLQPSGYRSASGRAPTPPPPPPPSNVGFLPALFPKTGRLPDFGAEAMAAGAMIFGDDFMSGPSFRSSFHSGSLGGSAVRSPTRRPD